MSNKIFGTLKSLAEINGYSHSYYKKTTQKKLTKLGRIMQTQGKPTLLCTETFIISAYNHAITKSGGDEYTLFCIDLPNQEPNINLDSVTFRKHKDSHFYAVGACLMGVNYLIEDAPMYELGVL